MQPQSANWSRIKQILADALEASSEDRGAIIERGCDGDAAIRDEVLSLLRASDTSQGVIDQRTDAFLGIGGPDLLTLGGQKIGKYTLVRLIAESSMAAVYEARQPDPSRAVALKLFRANLAMIDATHRFRREAEALARLQHPNIARIYEANVHVGPDGRATPYIAMEFVNGQQVMQFALDRKLPREGRIRLLIKIARAVQAAHQQAVIHRDLKPANVLVESTGEPKVLDFGIARVIGQDADAATWQTAAGVLLGTPGYMSPEQASGDVSAVDVRSDVWSLGVMLFELLVDRPPVDVRGASVAGALRKIETAEPPPIRTIDQSISTDLQTVVSTALSREKSQRYASAAALADDLERFLANEPISARAPTTWYIVRKFARRNRGKLFIAGTIAALIVAGSLLSSIGFLRARRERDRAQTVNRFLQEVLTAPDVSGAGRADITVLSALQSVESKIQSQFASDPLIEADVRGTLGWTYHSLGKEDLAERHLRRTVELLTRELGQRDAKTLEWRGSLVTVLRWANKPDEAREIAEHDLPIVSSVYGKNSGAMMSTLENLAGIAGDQGDWATAETRFAALLPRCRAALGADSPQTQTVLNNYAWVLMGAGKWPQAERMLRELVATQSTQAKERGGGPTQDELVVRSNLARAILNQGRALEAEPMLVELIDDATGKLGADHDQVLSMRLMLSDVYGATNQLDQSAAISREVMTKRLASLGEANGSTQRAMSAHALALMRLGQFAEAEALAQRALDAAVAAGGADSAGAKTLTQTLETIRQRKATANAPG